MSDVDIEAKQFSFMDVLLALVGHRASILRAIDSERGLLFMLAMVGIASICREYDGASFFHQPGELIKPLITSVILASVLFVAVILARILAHCRSEQLSSAYRRFLMGYWITAPLAWFYAVPVETFTDAITAVYLNLTLLSVVAVWRVALFTRIASVITGLPAWIVLCWIGPVCCFVACVAMGLIRLDIVGVMGGIRLSESEQILVNFTRQADMILTWIGWSLVLGFFASLFVLYSMRLDSPIAPAYRPCKIAKSNWSVLAAIFVALLGGCVYFQPKQFRAAQVNRLIKANSIGEAIALMERHQRDDYPAGQFVKRERVFRWSWKESIAPRIRLLLDLEVQPWIADQLIFSLPESLYDAAKEVVRADYRDPEKQLGELRELQELLKRLREQEWDISIEADLRKAFAYEMDAKIQQLESASQTN